MPVALFVVSVTISTACAASRPLVNRAASRTDPATTSHATASGGSPVPANVYQSATAGRMSSAVADALALVYVPSNDDGVVAVIDQKTYKEIARYPVGSLVQHVVPAYDLTRLYANASGANQLVPFDPKTGKPGVCLLYTSDAADE